VQAKLAGLAEAGRHALTALREPKKHRGSAVEGGGLAGPDVAVQARTPGAPGGAATSLADGFSFPCLRRSATGQDTFRSDSRRDRRTTSWTVRKAGSAT